MFSKLSLLVLVAPLVSALTLTAPSNVNSGGSFTLNWISDSTDASTFSTFSLELTNPAFNNAIAVANNVDASLGSITLTCPIVTAGGAYTIQAVDIGNINKVFAETSIFSIGETITSSGSASSAASATGTGASTTQAGTFTSAGSLPVTTGTSTAITPTGTSPSTGTGTGTGTAASTTPSSAAISSRLALTTVGAYTVLVLSAVAGAAAVAF